MQMVPSASPGRRQPGAKALWELAVCVAWRCFSGTWHGRGPRLGLGIHFSSPVSRCARPEAGCAAVPVAAPLLLGHPFRICAELRSRPSRLTPPSTPISPPALLPSVLCVAGKALLAELWCSLSRGRLLGDNLGSPACAAVCLVPAPPESRSQHGRSRLPEEDSKAQRGRAPGSALHWLWPGCGSHAAGGH